MLKQMAVYDAEFYTGLATNSRLSAKIVVPCIVNALAPTSIVDIGCGTGYWVEAFSDGGVPVCHGVDGPWASSASALSPGKDFFEFDFSRATVPFDIALPQQRYDLVTSFEFVEHIELPQAEALIDVFCRLSDVVVLGGAIPHQTGVNHVNEQWPGFWAELFAARGYVCCDFIRPQVWDDGRVQPWYAQNTLAYFKNSIPESVEDLAKEAWGKFAVRHASLVHPLIWDQAHPARTVRRAAFDLARAIKRAVTG